MPSPLDYLQIPFWEVLAIFANLDQARKTVRLADACEDPSYSIHYRKALGDLVRLEAQADAICFLTRKDPLELRKWAESRRPENLRNVL